MHLNEIPYCCFFDITLPEKLMLFAYAVSLGKPCLLPGFTVF